MDGLERWKWISGYEGRYEISDLGRIRSHFGRGRIMTPVGRKTYGTDRIAAYFVGLCKDGKMRTPLIHRLVLETFIGPCPEGLEGCHGDGDPGNNRLSNLRWDTRSSNAQDSIHHGTKPVGIKHHNAKLTDEDIRCIRAEPNVRGSGVMLAKCFGVTKTAIGNIRSGHSWHHIQQ